MHLIFVACVGNETNISCIAQFFLSQWVVVEGVRVWGWYIILRALSTGLRGDYREEALQGWGILAGVAQQQPLVYIFSCSVALCTQW